MKKSFSQNSRIDGPGIAFTTLSSLQTAFSLSDDNAYDFAAGADMRCWHVCENLRSAGLTSSLRLRRRLVAKSHDQVSHLNVST